jgi:hypothetical protein
MTLAFEKETIAIRRVRIQGSKLDPLLAQLRLTRLLNTTPWCPVGPPRSAVVCIRKLRNSSPVPLDLESRGSRRSASWEKTTAVAIDCVVRKAHRPALGFVPANAEAVIFADTAEVLACLASDWCGDQTLNRWWWQGLFRQADVNSVVLGTWLESPQYIPAALEHLARTQNLIPFARRLSAAVSHAMLRKVAVTFGLADLQSELEASLNKAQPGMYQTASAGQEAACRSASSSTRPSAAPWHRWVPESDSFGYLPEQQSLVGIGLMLIRAPTVIRSKTFAAEFHAWQRSWSNETASLSSDPSAQNSSSRKGQNSSEQDVSLNDSTGLKRVDRRSTHISEPVQGAGTVNEDLSVHDAGRLDSDPLTNQPTLTESLTGSPELLLNPVTSWPADNADTTKTLESGCPTSRQTGYDTHQLEQTIETECGGVFYFINLGIFLNLYGDFTSPLRPGLSLPIWDFLALLARELVGTRIQTDAVWPLLARLASRDAQDEPGRDFVPPEDWHLSSDWLTSASEASVGRFECQPQSNTPNPLSAWLAWLMPLVRARLQRALGLDRVDDLPSLVCEHRASVRVTTTHLDVTFSLAKLPIAIRLSGLDRDPGWVPAAARFIAFHYE